jgi:hypothetical protein
MLEVTKKMQIASSPTTFFITFSFFCLGSEHLLVRDDCPAGNALAIICSSRPLIDTGEVIHCNPYVHFYTESEGVFIDIEAAVMMRQIGSLACIAGPQEHENGWNSG